MDKDYFRAFKSLFNFCIKNKKRQYKIKLNRICSNILIRTVFYKKLRNKVSTKYGLEVRTYTVKLRMFFMR